MTPKPYGAGRRVEPQSNRGLLGDVNGGGRADIVAFGDQHVFVALGPPVIDELRAVFSFAVPGFQARQGQLTA